MRRGRGNFKRTRSNRPPLAPCGAPVSCRDLKHWDQLGERGATTEVTLEVTLGRRMANILSRVSQGAPRRVAGGARRPSDLARGGSPNYLFGALSDPRSTVRRRSVGRP